MKEEQNLTPFEKAYWKKLGMKMMVAIGYKFALFATAIAGAYHFDLVYRNPFENFANTSFNLLLGLVAIVLVVHFLIKYVTSLSQVYSAIDF